MAKITMDVEGLNVGYGELPIMLLIEYLLRYSYSTVKQYTCSNKWLQSWGIKKNVYNNSMTFSYCLEQVKHNQKKEFENDLYTLECENVSKPINWKIVDGEGKVIIKREEISGGANKTITIPDTFPFIPLGVCYVINHDAKFIYSITKEEYEC